MSSDPPLRPVPQHKRSAPVSQQKKRNVYDARRKTAAAATAANAAATAANAAPRSPARARRQAPGGGSHGAPYGGAQGRDPPGMTVRGSPSRRWGQQRRQQHHRAERAAWDEAYAAVKRLRDRRAAVSANAAAASARANSSTASARAVREPAALCIQFGQRDDWLSLAHAAQELAHAILAHEVAARTED